MHWTFGTWEKMLRGWRGVAAEMKTVDGAEEKYVAEAKVLRGAEHMAIDGGILVLVSGGGGRIMVVTRRRALIR